MSLHFGYAQLRFRSLIVPTAQSDEPGDGPDALEEIDEGVFAAGEEQTGLDGRKRGQADYTTLQGAEESGTSKPHHKRKADDANLDERMNDILLTYIAESMPLGRSPTSKRNGTTSHRNSAKGQDSIPAVRDLLWALFTSQQAGGKYTDPEEEEGFLCDQCPKRAKRACDMK
jgi:hypothetical protein